MHGGYTYNDFSHPFGFFDQRNPGFTNQPPGWIIFGQDVIDAGIIGSKPGIAMSLTGPNGEEAPDWLKMAGSVRELAEQIGIDPDALEATVERYNTYAEKGEDPDWGDPGQTHVLTGPDTVNRKPITGPTFGAIQQWPGTLGTNGGLRIDKNARVLGYRTPVIDGLYAAGNTSASVLGAIYGGGGSCIGPSVTFGYIAGRHLAGKPSRDIGKVAEPVTGLLSFDETSRFLDTPKGKLHYHVAGDGPPLLLLHGSGPGVSGWANFRGNLPVFARDYTTYVLDFPGFGKSYSPDANPLAVGPAGVLDFLDGLGLGPLPIIGNSMGGNVAARIAAEHPERVSRLMCIGGVGLSLLSPSPPEGIKLLVEFVENPTRERLVQWMESMVYDTAILTDEFVQMRWESATDPSAPSDIKKLYNRAMLEGMRRGRAFGAVDAVSVLTKIQAPTLVMFGRDDRVTPMDGSLAAMRLIPKCELHVFYDCGHWAMIERKDEFESTVLAFLARDHQQ